jgi:transposase
VATADAEWERLRPFLPVSNGRCGRWRDHRQVIDGILHRVRTGVQWRDLPERFGPWKTVYERHRLWSADGTWERLLQQVQAAADAAGEIDWDISVDSTVVRAGADEVEHQDETPWQSLAGRLVEVVLDTVHLSADGRCRPLSPEKTDSQAARLRKGSRGGRPPGFDEERYKKRTSALAPGQRQPWPSGSGPEDPGRSSKTVLGRPLVPTRHLASVLVEDLGIVARVHPSSTRSHPNQQHDRPDKS